MKKILFLLPLFAIALTGCSNNNEQSLQGNGNDTNGQISGPKKIVVQLNISNYRTYLNVKETMGGYGNFVAKMEFNGAIYNGIYDDASVTYTYNDYGGEKATETIALSKSGYGLTPSRDSIEVQSVTGTVTYWN